MRRASSSVVDTGFEPLDELDGRLGGQRHGAWDWTWVSHRPVGAACFASVYAFPIGANRFEIETWAHLGSNGAAQRSLVRRFSAVPEEPDELLAKQLIDSVVEGARRAFYLDHGIRQAFFEDREKEVVARPMWAHEFVPDIAIASELARAPHHRTVEEVEMLIRESPGRQWRNREILVALLEQGHPTDRAAVNAALSELAGSGRIRRLSRGVYTA